MTGAATRLRAMTWMLGPEECTGYQSMTEQGVTTSRMVHDKALSGFPMTVNTGGGVTTLLTDGCINAGRALNNAICTICGAVQSGVAAMAGAMMRLWQMVWMPKPDE